MVQAPWNQHREQWAGLIRTDDCTCFTGWWFNTVAVVSKIHIALPPSYWGKPMWSEWTKNCALDLHSETDMLASWKSYLEICRTKSNYLSALNVVSHCIVTRQCTCIITHSAYQHTVVWWCILTRQWTWIVTSASVLIFFFFWILWSRNCFLDYERINFHGDWYFGKLKKHES